MRHADREDAIKYRNNPKWIRKRLYILGRDRNQCQECKRYGRSTSASMVHHIVPPEFNPEYFYLNENLLSICDKCHDEFHDRTNGKLTEKGLNLMRRNLESIEKAYENSFLSGIPPALVP